MEKELYNDLLNATQYCRTIEEFGDCLTDKQDEIELWKANYMNDKEWKEGSCKRWRTASMIIFFPNLIFWGLALMVEIYMIFFDEDRKSMIPQELAALKICMMATIAILAFFTFVSLILFIIAKIRMKKVKSDFKERKRRLDTDIAEMEKSISDIRKAIDKFVEENQQVLKFLPGQYRNLQATSFMLLAVKNQRADTLKEAINLYEEQLHRWRLEDAARQTAETQACLAMAVDELNSQQAETNAHLRTIEFMQYMQYWRDKWKN